MTLTYLARAGEDPNRDEVIVPQVAQLLAASNLSYVTVRGLTFEHDNFTVPYPHFTGPSDRSTRIERQATAETAAATSGSRGPTSERW